MSGALLPDRWDASSSAIDPSRVFISANPKHQALLLADHIATSPPNQSTAELLISTPDASDQLPIQRQLAEFDLDVSLPAGRQLIATGPGILIRLISNFISEQSYKSLSAILRHPEVLRTLTPGLNPVSVMSELADYHESRLPFDTANFGRFARPLGKSLQKRGQSYPGGYNHSLPRTQWSQRPNSLTS